MVEFDCLESGQVTIARASITSEEKAARAFDAAFPREFPVGLRHAHYYWRKLETARLDLSRVRAFSKATTGYIPGLRLIHIAKLVARLRPKLVYEFGSGVSTVFFAQLLQPYGGKIVSFEQSPKFYDRLQPAFPAELRDTADIRLAPVALDWFGPYRGIFFDTEPPPAVDLVYIDGPTRTRGNVASDIPYPRINADLVRMIEAGTSVAHAFTDHRWANFPAYERLLPNHRVRCSRWWKSIIVTPIARPATTA